MMDEYSDYGKMPLPVPEGSFSINRSPFAYSVKATIHNNVSHVEQMRFSNTDGPWSQWVPYSRTMDWELPYGNGEQTVYGEFLDTQGALYSSKHTITFIDRITASDRAYDEYFGWSLALSGDGRTIVCGTNKGLQGAVYVYSRENPLWNEQKIINPEGGVKDKFGYSVSISTDGNTLLAGSPGIDNERGAALIFIKDPFSETGWKPVTTLHSFNGTSSNRFGQSVVLSGDGNTAVVGAPGFNNELGAVYVFRRDEGGVNNWGLVTWLIAEDGRDADQFGSAAAISADASTIAIGAPYHRTDEFRFNQGTVYVFTQSGLTYGFQKKITSRDGAEGDYFGKSVLITLDGTKIIAGADGTDTESIGDDRGSVYVFNRDEGGTSNWGQWAKLTAPDSEVSDRFGRSIAASGNGSTILVGAPQHNSRGFPDSGAIYRFTLTSNGYIREEKIVAPDGMPNDSFGTRIALTQNGAGFAVGSFQDDIDSLYDDAGSVYIFQDNEE